MTCRRAGDSTDWWIFLLLGIELGLRTGGRVAWVCHWPTSIQYEHRDWRCLMFAPSILKPPSVFFKWKVSIIFSIHPNVYCHVFWDHTTQVGTWTHCLIIEITHLVSGLHEVQVLDVSAQKEFFQDRVIGKKWIYLERNTLPRQSVGLHRRWGAWNAAWLVFMDWVIS